MSRAIQLRRNTPSLLNSNRYDVYGWDGRSLSLAAHIEGVLRSPVEMAYSEEVVRTAIFSSRGLSAGYATLDAGGTYLDFIVSALTSFVEGLATREILFDSMDALKAPKRHLVIRRHRLFIHSGCCASHRPPHYTDNLFHDVNLPRRRIVLQADPTKRQEERFTLGPDHGRGDIVSGVDHLFAFRTPSLINVDLTAPYMHDGRFQSLREVLDIYEREAQTTDGKRLGRDWSKAEREALEAFLESLVDVRFVSKRSG